MRLTDAIHKRRSIKRFHHRKPDWRKIIRAIDTVRYAPSAGNQFSMKFIIVQEPKLIQQLAQASQQPFIGTAHYVIVALNNDEKLIRHYGERGKRYASQQSGAAIQNLLLALTEQKLATTWVGYFYEEQIKATLNIPDNMVVEALFPIGKTTKHRIEPKKRIDLENVLYFDEWNNKIMQPQTRVRAESI